MSLGNKLFFVARAFGFGALLASQTVGCQTISTKTGSSPTISETTRPPQRLRRKWGYIDKSGRFRIAPVFDMAYAFSDGRGLALMFSEGAVKRGYINKNGRYAIQPRYDDAHPFLDGLAAVKIKDKWGFINRRGKLVIKAQFDFVQGFTEGLAPVEVDGRWGYITRNQDLSSRRSSKTPTTSAVV